MYAEWPVMHLDLWPVGPSLAFVILATIPAAMAAETWLIRSKTHLIGAAAGLLMVSQVYAPGRSMPPLVVSLAVTAWIPWAVALAVFREPERPRLGLWTAIAGVAGACIATLYDFFATPLSEFRPNAVLLAGGLMIVAPLLAGARRRHQITLCAAVAVVVGLAVMAVQGFPWRAGLAPIALLPLGLWAGHQAERRWSGDGPTQARMAFIYVLFAAVIFLPEFLPGHDRMGALQLATAVYLAIAALLVVAVLVADLVQPFIERRRAIGGPT
jgi:hypothetical protein